MKRAPYRHTLQWDAVDRTIDTTPFFYPTDYDVFMDFLPMTCEALRTELEAVPKEHRKTVLFMHLRSVSITSIPRTLIDFCNLASLDLRDNALATVPMCIFSLPKLVLLNLCENYIQAMPKEIQQLTSLDTLLLGYPSPKEGVVKLPASIANCTKLKNLTIHASFAIYPPTMTRLVKLRILLAPPMHFLTGPRPIAEFFRDHAERNTYREARNAVVTFLALRKFRRSVWTGPYKDVVVYMIAPMLYETREDDEWIKKKHL